MRPDGTRIAKANSPTPSTPIGSVPDAGIPTSSEAESDLVHNTGHLSFAWPGASSPCRGSTPSAGSPAARSGDMNSRDIPMDYAKPAEVAASMLESANNKLRLPPRDLLIRGILSSAILGVATSLAFNAALSTGQPLVGAIVFPVGLVMIVLLGLELV